MEEILSLRQENSKTFDIGKGKKRLDIFMGAVHYKDDYTNSNEAWKDIDLAWEGNRITKAPYELTLDGQKLTVKNKKTSEVSTIELLSSKPVGLKWEIIPEHTRVSFRHILPPDKIPFEAKFKVTGKIPFGTRAFDNDGELLLGATLVDGILTEKLSSIVGKEIGIIRLAEGNIRIDPTWQVGTGTDDCQRKLDPATFWDLAYSRFIAGRYGVGNAKIGAGARFTNITIPLRAYINQAYLTLTCYASQTGVAPKTRISAEQVDDAPTFADDKDVFDARWANRTAQVDWDDIENWTSPNAYNSPDIKTVIQAIIDRAGWVSGNDIVIFWEDFEGRSVGNEDDRHANAYEAGGAPQLIITYTPLTPAVWDFFTYS